MTLVGPGATVVVWRLRADPSAAEQARRLVRDALGALPLGDELVDDAVLMVSELVGNAVQHGEPPFELALRVGGGELRAEIVDSGPGVPLTRAPDSQAERGRGLGIVAGLSRGRYGCRPAAYATERGRHGKAVWCALPIDPPPPADAPPRADAPSAVG